eukprot:2095186-Prymnesium_polylepis.1
MVHNADVTLLLGRLKRTCRQPGNYHADFVECVAAHEVRVGRAWLHLDSFVKQHHVACLERH